LKKSIVLTLFCFIIVSCHSTKTYNEKATKIHSVEDLKDDVDFLFKNLEKNFPRLYDYIAEDDLRVKISEFKTQLEPMNSADFYQRLLPLVAEIRQGHLLIRRPFTIRDKAERKKYRRAKEEYDDLNLAYIENGVYIEKTYGDLDSLLVGSQVMALDSVSTGDLIEQWKYKITSDGFNTTFQTPIIAENLLTFYRYDVGRTDSIELHLQKSDSLFTKKLRIVLTEKDNNSIENDTLTSSKEKDSLISPKKLTKAEKRKQKKERKEKMRDQLKRGYNGRTKEDTREFRFIGKDTNVAYLKIRSFSGGDRWSRKFYEETFHLIDSLKTENLVLDLRDNTGGSLKEIGDLYSYLAKDEFQFIQPMEAKKRLVITRSMWSGKNSFFGGFFRSIATPFTFTIDLVKSKKKDGVVYHRNKYSKINEPQPNAFKGNVYVLINGSSYSASSVISTNLHGSQRAVFLGEETGGAYNGTVAGIGMSKYLPNSQILVPVWMMHLETPYKEEPNGYGVKPDIEVKQSLEDFFEGKDTVLERALEEIQQN
jgi:hypothetical protein